MPCPVILPQAHRLVPDTFPGTQLFPLRILLRLFTFDARRGSEDPHRQGE